MKLIIDKISHGDEALAWRQPVDVALDHHGPVDVAYDPLPPDFLHRPLFALFESVVARNPTALALADETSRVSYGALHAKAVTLARQIIATVPAGRAVAMLLPQSADAVAAVLACLAASRVVLLLNAEHPDERNATILQDSGVAAVILSSAAPIPSWLPNDVLHIVVPPASDDTIEAIQLPSVLATPDEPAVVLYTSGSTGRPKGIVQSQQSILCRAYQNMSAQHLNPADKVLVFSATCTIAGLIATIAVLLSGASLFAARNLSAGNVLSLIARERMTVLLGLPALLRVLFAPNTPREDLASVRVIRTTGDALLRSDIDAWRAVLPESCAFNITYGMTEVAFAQWFVARDFASESAPLPAGYPMPDQEFAILDEDGAMVPDGEPGELVVRSRSIACGEWQDGRCVTGRMQPDPHDPTLRIFHTGDVVQLRPDGMLQFIARRDRQIRIRGQRIEPAEIEDVLRRSPGVADAAIVARRDGDSTLLLAFVAAADDSDSETLRHALHHRLHQSLPSAMQPSRIVIVSALPRLPGGKVDQRALLALEAGTARQSSAAPAAGMPAASQQARDAVARAWAQTLDRGSLADDLPFDASGGDSLRLLMLIFRLEEQLQTTLPLDLFTIGMRPSEFAASLDRCRSGAPMATGDGPLLFLLPGMGKDEPRLAGLRTSCAPNLRIVPIDYGDWREWVAQHVDFEALVSRIVTTIEVHAPTGPLMLAGYSLGGFFAYAAAARLSQAGRKVAFLSLLDTNAAVSNGDQDVATGPDRIVEYRRIAEGLRSGTAAAALAEYMTRRLTSPRWVPLLRVAARLRRTWPPGDFGFYLHWQLTMRLLSSLVAAWRPRMQPVPALQRVPTVLFRAGERDRTLDDLGWRSYCPGLTIVPVGGGHHSMLDPPNLASLTAYFVHAARASIEGSPLP